MEAAGLGAVLGGPLQAMAPMLRTLGVVVIGVGGCMLFAMIGSMSYPGIGAIIGAVFGFLIFSCIGFVVLGKYKDIIRGGGDLVDLPGFVSEHPAFQLIMTVHGVTLVDEETLCGMGAGKLDCFVIVKCGINPDKATCVREDGKWNETFRVNVRAKDKSLVCALMDQNTFGDSKIGQVTLEIDDDIIDRAFPQEKKFKVEPVAMLKDAPKCEMIISFDHGPDFPQGRISHLENQYPHEFTKRRQRQLSSMKEWSGVKNYGSLAHQLNYSKTDPHSLDHVKNLNNEKEMMMEQQV